MIPEQIFIRMSQYIQGVHHRRAGGDMTCKHRIVQNIFLCGIVGGSQLGNLVHRVGFCLLVIGVQIRVSGVKPGAVPPECMGCFYDPVHIVHQIFATGFIHFVGSITVTSL